MPKYTPKLAKARAKRLIKAYKEAGFNQTELAKREGVSQSAIAQRLARKHVQKTMAEVLDKAGCTDEFLGKKIMDGCDAQEKIILRRKGKKPVVIEKPDNTTQHKYVTTALEVKKHIRADEPTKPMKLVVEYGHRQGKKKESES